MLLLLFGFSAAKFSLYYMFFQKQAKTTLLLLERFNFLSLPSSLLFFFLFSFFLKDCRFLDSLLKDPRVKPEVILG